MRPNPPGQHVAPAPGDLHRRFAPDATRLAALRAALGRWAEGVGASRELREDVVLAAHEAMANAAEHAYAGRPDGVIDLYARRTPDSITVVVTDYGAWRPPLPGNGLRGRGLMLIKALTARNDVIHDSTGTTVTMTWPF